MKFKELHRNVRFRIFQSFFSSLLGTMVYPFMAIYFTKYFGASITGILLMANVIIGILASFYGGYIADRIGRKKLLVGSELIQTAAFFLAAWANSPSHYHPAVTIVVIFANSIFWGLSGPASTAMLIDVSTSENRKMIFSTIYWIKNLSFAIGGIIGPFLFQSYLFELFLGLGTLSILTLGLMMIFIVETYFPDPSKINVSNNALVNMFRSYRMVFQDNTFMLYFFASALAMTLEFQMTNYISVRLVNEFTPQTISFPWFTLHLDGIKLAGFLRTENTAIVAGLGVILIILAKKWSDRFTLNFGMIIYTIGYSILGFSNQPIMLFAAMFLASIGELLTVPVRQAYLGEIAPDHARSTYMAVNGLVFRVGMIISALFVSIIHLVPSWIVSSSFFIMGLCSIFLFERMAHKQRNQLQVNVQSTTI